MIEPREKAKILVVDDLREKLLVYETILKDLNETLVLVQSGEEALKQILTNDFALVLLDVNMPGMDGLETASLIRKRTRSAHLPIIFVTSYVDDIRSQAGYAQGAVDYILAPVDPVILRTKVKVFVDLHRMQLEVEKRANERIVLAEETARRILAEKMNRDASFLAQASRSFSQSHNGRVIVEKLAKMCVPFLAPGALAGFYDPGHPLVIESSFIKGLFSDHAISDFQQFLHSIMSEPDSQIKKQMIETRSLPDLAEQWPDGVVLTVPLMARGALYGCLALLGQKQAKGELEKEMPLIEEVCARAATALDTSLLLSSIQEADQRKDEFLAMLAHELRNPLAPIRNAVEILKQVDQSHPRFDQARELILKQTHHLTHLVDDLLDVSRITRGKINLKLKDHLLTEIVENAVETSLPVITLHGHQLQIDQCKQSIFVHGDATRLSQVLSNLLSNAAKYSPTSGHIWLTTDFQNEQAIIKIKDSGIGIPHELQGKIFDLFAQANNSLEKSQGGLGIGLTLVRRLVELHQGRVEVFSDGLDHGSEFTVTLPARIQAAPFAKNEADYPVSLAPLSKRVLVVDDNKDAAESMAMLLELLGNEVITANDGMQAIQRAECNQPDVILLDIGLPGMNGYEVTRRIRSETWGKSMFIIAVTGWGQDQDKQRAIAAGFDDHLTKPVEPSLLKEKLTSR